MNSFPVDNHRPLARPAWAGRGGRKALDRDTFPAEPLT